MQNKRAVITGASAGIGQTFAHELAKQGYDLLLIARRQERLVALAEQLSADFGIAAEPYACDLAQHDDLHALAAHLRTQNVALLVNNAGFGTGGTLAETAVDRQLDMLTVHVTATYLLTQAVLPQMLGQQHGDIINVGSIAGFMFSAENVNYCATKAYITQFSRGLDAEVRDAGIRVQALCPGFTYTEFHDSADMVSHFDRSQFPASLWMAAEDVVAISLAALPKGKVVVIPGKRNQMIVRSSQTGLGKQVRRAAKFVLRRR